MSLRASLALIVGVAIGLSLADVDQVFSFLRHRSIITHSVLLPFLAYLLVKEPERRWLQFGIIGLSVGMAIHLSFDLFPRSWYGYALITIPLIGSIGPTLSVLSLLGNIIACVYLALMLLQQKMEAYIVGGVAAISFLFSWGVGANTSLWSLILLVFATGIAMLFPNTIVNGQKIARRFIRRMKTTSA